MCIWRSYRSLVVYIKSDSIWWNITFKTSSAIQLLHLKCQTDRLTQIIRRSITLDKTDLSNLCQWWMWMYILSCIDREVSDASVFHRNYKSYIELITTLLAQIEENEPDKHDSWWSFCLNKVHWSLMFRVTFVSISD